MKDLQITVVFNKEVANVDYIEFKLADGTIVNADYIFQYAQEVTINRVNLPARVLGVQELDLGNIPLENQVARIVGVEAIQTYINDKERQDLFPVAVNIDVEGRTFALTKAQVQPVKNK